ncbi:MAG: hypothetical protein LBU58_06840, partial [Clostridiales bacterium]|nr:hypothetical protein [Clostridiales bacterium]
QMTFAHWANVAAQKFDYTIDPTLTFSNELNKQRTADSAAALYFDLGTIPAGGEKSFSTFYGVTANLKNRDNQVLINTTAPAKLQFNESRTAYIGSGGAADNLIRINSTVSNPILQGVNYKKLAVVVYAIGFTTQRQTDGGTWIPYNNNDPLYTDIVDFAAGQNLTTFFDFKFEPRDNHELGSFVTRVYNMDPAVNELGVYAEDYELGETTNYIFIPAKDPSLPSITLHGMEPSISYNDERRFLTVSGAGMSFFANGLQAIELRGENQNYSVPTDNLTIAADTKSVSVLLEDYMAPGPYQLCFLWDGNQPDDVPNLFTSSAMRVHMTSDESYRSDKYGILTVQRDTGAKYKIVPYKDEADFAGADGRNDATGYDPEDLIFTFRGELIKDKTENLYRMAGKDKDININHILNYRGSDFVVTQSASGTVEVLMNGKLTTIGANTTVRSGSAAFKLNAGTNYVVPEYDSRGTIVEGDSLGANEEYIELMWNNAVDALQTIGGFLIDLKYGLMGKIQDANNPGKTYDIISFGGGLDLSFMTPGGAKTARENKTKDASWDLSDINGNSGLEPWRQPEASEKAPTTEAVHQLEAGATVHDVLYGQNGKKTGHIGINMDAHLQLPQIVSFLPARMSGDLSINTIGGYRVGIEGEADAANFSLAFALVIKSNPSGAPIPDKLFFSIGGFEPGINVDSLGIFWVTGGGGGFDNLYDTIYGTDGIPPFKLLLNVQFDIFKIMTGAADLELSLRAFSIRLSDVSLKMIKNARFLDGGGVSATWYPNFDLSVYANVNFLQVFKGNFSLVANEKLFEMMIRVALSLPADIPLVGGMEVASAELGGGTEKLWGSVALLGFVKVGFVYWWDSGDLKITSSGASSRTLMAFRAMTAPTPVGTDPETGETRYVSVGGNLVYITGNVPDQSLTKGQFAALKSSAPPSAPSMQRTRGLVPTNIISNPEQSSHVITFGEPSGDYILTVSRADGQALSPDFAGVAKMWNNGAAYPLSFYQKPNLIAGLGTGEELTDAEKAAIGAAAANANVNVVGNVAYIVIPKAKQTNPQFLLEFADGGAYDVGAVLASPISELTGQTAVADGGRLKVDWTGEALDTATVSVSISDVPDADGILLAKDIPAKNLSAEIALPDTVASGNYTVRLTLIDEGTCYASYNVGGAVSITDAKAPTAPASASLVNAGNDKLRVMIADDFAKDKLEGYYVDVYEDGLLKEAAVYYSKEQAAGGQILIGGRYDVPETEEYIEGGETKYRQKTDESGAGLYRTIGFTPGRQYSVKVRAGASETTDEGDVYHYSAYVMSSAEALVGATPPTLAVTASGAVAGIEGADFGLASGTNSFILSANEPVKGTLTVDGASGATYTFDGGYQTEWQQELALPDGLHTLEFDAADAEGNRSIFQTTVSVDTAAPSLMLESPINGGVFTGGEILIKGAPEQDARYTFLLDGAVVGEADRDMSAYFENGILTYALPISGGASRHTLEITAKDAVGNSVTKRMEVTDDNLPEITRVELHQDGKPISVDKILLNKAGDTVHLRLMGITGSGGAIDLTDA